MRSKDSKEALAYYVAEVYNGGHEQWIGNRFATPAEVAAIDEELMGLQSDKHLEIWVSILRNTLRAAAACAPEGKLVRPRTNLAILDSLDGIVYSIPDAVLQGFIDGDSLLKVLREAGALTARTETDR